MAGPLAAIRASAGGALGGRKQEAAGAAAGALGLLRGGRAAVLDRQPPPQEARTHGTIMNKYSKQLTLPRILVPGGWVAI
jgi:hypothetical protein